MSKEAQARVKINKLLEAAGWRFFDDSRGAANISLEPNVKLTEAQVDAMGNDFESASKGFVDLREPSVTRHHADRLRALTGKNECNFHDSFLL